ncbi:hypothetical protein V1292_006601 [Bradyrhizobium sp. AZCC 1719]|uniref:hypothetical protein n=1 Tax=Bradyrhizobium sp. AZCC 1719 TaxID=3117028 RepID=UPI002FF1374A
MTFNMAIKPNDPVPLPSGSQGVGLGHSSDLAGIPGARQDQAFDGIDWSRAAPGWASMFIGLLLPLLGLALLVGAIDFALGWLFKGWIAPSWQVSPLLLAATMLPPALVGALGCCKLFLYSKDAMRTAARSGKHEGVV